MSWGTIAAALQARIAAIQTDSQVHAVVKHLKEDEETPDFKALFANKEATDINFWMISRVSDEEKKSESDANRWLNHHTAEILHVRGLHGHGDSETPFQADLDAIIADFRTGDRTLGNIAEFFTDIHFPRIDLVKFSKATCHMAHGILTVEEVISNA